MDKIDMNKIQELLDSSKALLKETKAMEDGVNFLIKEYNTNKRWFREQPGRVTVEDVIKAAFEFGWASKRNFDYDQGRKESAV